MAEPLWIIDGVMIDAQDLHSAFSDLKEARLDLPAPPKYSVNLGFLGATLQCIIARVRPVKNGTA